MGQQHQQNHFSEKNTQIRHTSIFLKINIFLDSIHEVAMV
jgi:hypothetical protein